MKRLLVGTALLTWLAAPALAAPTLWQGDLFITAVNDSAACDAVSMRVSDFARFSFRPKSVAGNGATDVIFWNFQRSSGHMLPDGGVLNTATTATVRYIHSSAAFSQVTASPIDATVSGEGTATVLMTIRIDNIYSSSRNAPSGCNATFRGALTKRPPSP